LKRAASSGSVAAQYHLGLCFRGGWGTEVDDVHAVEYFKMAAEAGHVDALYTYAYCWIHGIGVEKNPEYGIALLRTAANVGSVHAMYGLGRIYRRGRLYGVEEDMNESLRWYNEAAEREDTDAMMIVGKCLIEGKGVVRNVRKVYSIWCTLAHTNRRGIGVMNKKKSLEFYHRAEKYEYGRI